VWSERPAERERLLETLRALIDAEGAPPEQPRRLGLA
jgi:hypothetical protein